MIGNRFAILCSIAVMALAFPANAEEPCAPFPRVALWGEYTHATVRKHVNETLAGDWTAYIGELRRQLETLRKLHARDAGAAISRDGRTVNLRGESLAQYIKHADRRLGIARCLADHPDADNVASFSTAAGPGTNPSAAAETEPMQRSVVTIPEDMLDQLRRIAVRRSVQDGRQVSVSEVVVELLERELRHSRR